ncbi:hypothetical protein DdX_14328 [Ditylenchus destructor]|uniref:Uncharacterized protein n=1 Tax=Ditylenchus destructor TaxID=166010 RepID=A0AAD4R201_9BILA|nr:hypothetical protein DdX_14328 [Ditylenchus destructor]
MVPIYIIGVYAMLRLPLDVLKAQNCQSAGCVDLLSNKNMIYRDIIITYAKITVSAINILLMFYFLWLLHRTSSDKMNDRLVKITIIVDVALDSVPILIYRIFFIYGSDSIVAIYMGQSVGFLFVLRMAVCAIIYWIILLKTWYRGTESSVSEVSMKVGQSRAKGDIPDLSRACTAPEPLEQVCPVRAAEGREVPLTKPRCRWAQVQMPQVQMVTYVPNNMAAYMPRSSSMRVSAF